MVFKMWDFLPMERDEYVSAEDDAVMAEHEREKKHNKQVVQEEKDQAFIDENEGSNEYDPSDGDESAYVNDGPEFSQEYEAPEDIYLEAAADSNDD